MVHNIAVYLSKHLAEYIGWQEKTAYLAYGMEMFVGELLKFLILVGLSAFFGMVTPTLLILAVTIPFRLTSGGGHLKTYTNCAIVTILVFFALASTANELIPLFNLASFPIYLSSLYAFTILIIQVWVPGKHPAKDFSLATERLKFKRLSRVIITLWAMICLIVYLAAPAALATFFISTAMGIVWQNFLVSPLGYKFLAITEAILTLRTKEVN